jgi:hypothetical protein
MTGGPAKTSSGPAAAGDRTVKVTIYHNVTRRRSYWPGQPVVKVFRYQAVIGPAASRALRRGAPLAVDIAESTYIISALPAWLLNNDELSFAPYQLLGLRPLALGDLVQVGDVTLACDPAGWHEVSSPWSADG